MNTISRLFIAFFFSAGVLAFADQPSSSLDDKPSVDTAASSAVQVPSVPADASASTSPNYLYDLKKLIEKSRANIKEVNEKIKEQAVLKRNQKREERAREYYEKGLALTNEGKLDEARDYFEKAVAITNHPEMAGYIKESQRRLKKQEDALQAQEREHYKQIKQDENSRKEDVEGAYRGAVDLYKQKKYHPAKDAFEHVNEIAPDYRATDSYLKIIDQDIVTEDAIAAKQQAVEIQRQQKEAEAARAKEKQAWLAQIEEKEKEHKESVDKQAQEVYDQAVESYKNKKFADAKKKFEEVSWVLPDYKATMKYLARIDRDAQDEQERLAREQEKSLEQQRWEQEVERKKHETLRDQAREAQELRSKKDLEDQADFLYMAAVNLYDKKDRKESLDKFVEIEKLLPDYKATRAYMTRIGKEDPSLAPMIPKPQLVVVTHELSPMTATLEDQQKQAQDITALAARSTRLYRQISAIADDRLTGEMKRKMGRVNDILINLMNEKDRLVGRMREDQLRSYRQAHRAEAEKMYETALNYYRSHDYEKAKFEFANLEGVYPDYRSTRRYLSRIDELQQRSMGIVANNGSSQTGRVSMVESAQAIQLHKEEMALEELAGKASDINDEIIRLSKEQDYEAIKAKFTVLENTVLAIKTLKDEMAQQKDHQQREKESARQSDRQRIEMLKAQQQQQERQNNKYYKAPLSENGGSFKAEDTEKYKRRDMQKEEDMLYNEGVDCYRHDQYTQAKLLFSELADQHDRRAWGWLKKVDRQLSQQLLTNQLRQEKERSAFLADQLKSQRELAKLQERERQRQKKLTEEMERQKRLYEDDRSMQLRKEQTMKAQEQERQGQEAKHSELEAESKKQEEMYRFHKIENGTVAAPQPPPVSATSGSSSAQPSSAGTPTLEAQRDSIRKQLEDGVEEMYQEAMGLYQKGEYAAAAGRFKDVQDILPGYKSAQQYMDQAHLRSLAENSQSAMAPDMSADASNAPMPFAASSASPSISRQDSVSKALDLFDSK